VERAAARSAGRGTSVIDAHGQADQCRFSLGILDPACQHHDARAWHVRDGIRTAYARIVVRRERAIAITAPDAGLCGGSPCLGGGQKAACAETSTHGCAGSDFAGSGRAGASSVSARGVK
jgi:hypothetical protein